MPGVQRRLIRPNQVHFHRLAQSFIRDRTRKDKICSALDRKRPYAVLMLAHSPLK